MSSLRMLRGTPIEVSLRETRNEPKSLRTHVVGLSERKIQSPANRSTPLLCYITKYYQLPEVERSISTLNE